MIFAGQRYREFLVLALHRDGYKVDVPMENPACWRTTGMAGRAIMSRTDDLIRLYRILDKLEAQSGGKGFLINTLRKLGREGVYFFFEPGRFARVAVTAKAYRCRTHALGVGARSTLHQRLRQHASGIIRRPPRWLIEVNLRVLIGEALIARGDCPGYPS